MAPQIASAFEVVESLLSDHHPDRLSRIRFLQTVFDKVECEARHRYARYVSSEPPDITLA